VSDQENIKPDDESDVEAHGSKPPVKLAKEDDFELHGSKPPVKLANDEGKDDSGDDDVELHKKSAKL
jgi:hypothetical protein